ncbi:MAG: HNH endonuclease [Porphyromonadaceae bacterium]|nr:HNH endonuclease [Porphyromonadaceae bacterium]
MSRVNKRNISSYLARKAYREFFGEIPCGFQIHHKDRNKMNNTKENLIALSPSDHRLEHCKMKEVGFDRYWEIQGVKTGIDRLNEELIRFNYGIIK